MAHACALRQGWFDDKVEARNAVVRVAQIFDARWLDRRDLPWLEPGERRRPQFRPGTFRRMFEKKLSSYPLFGPEARAARSERGYWEPDDGEEWDAGEPEGGEPDDGGGPGADGGDAGDGGGAVGLEGEPREVLQAVGAGRMGQWEDEDEE